MLLAGEGTFDAANGLPLYRPFEGEIVRLAISENQSLRDKFSPGNLNPLRLTRMGPRRTQELPPSRFSSTNGAVRSLTTNDLRKPDRDPLNDAHGCEAFRIRRGQA